MKFEHPIDYKRAKKQRRARKEAKRKKYGVEQKKYFEPPHPDIPEKLTKLLFNKYHWHKIEIKTRAEMDGLLGSYGQRAIFLSEVLFDKKNKDSRVSLEEVLLHELGHLVDEQVPGKMDPKEDSTNSLNNEVVAELFTYLVIAEGDIFEAEKVARETYKNNRLEWIGNYDIKNIKHQNVNWNKSIERVKVLYNSKITKEICEAMDLEYKDLSASE